MQIYTRQTDTQPVLSVEAGAFATRQISFLSGIFFWFLARKELRPFSMTKKKHMEMFRQ